MFRASSSKYQTQIRPHFAQTGRYKRGKHLLSRCTCTCQGANLRRPVMGTPQCHSFAMAIFKTNAKKKKKKKEVAVAVEGNKTYT
ncbi:hypothetical protein POVWA2_081780 [Plasmodium ovale wallikeri]|uniref:Uncharacterized protein n=1 Tax=Plasmodium ovale wallikeri TaxID=864142 RepID=A0A1A8ZNU6_PLAOA|nr:hypothetical protein POVWA1_052090 [Plasmodium ovale wallikeri]SBT57821.1 hypothetical protein POVWA2_081780 [Plasmodium ovale wallikeri]